MTTHDMRVVVTDFDLDNVGDEWEALVSAGQAIAAAHDTNRWALGDLGNKCERRYGDDSIGSYAAAINIRPTTMYDYVACSAFYSIEDRAAFPPLNWSHYRAATKAAKRETAMIWLAKAADEGWTVDQLSDALKVQAGQKPTPKKLLMIGAQYVDLRPKLDETTSEISSWDIVFRVVPSANIAIDEALKLRQVVTLKIYGAAENGESNDGA